jgi:hypothetical protein
VARREGTSQRLISRNAPEEEARWLVAVAVVEESVEESVECVAEGVAAVAVMMVKRRAMDEAA